MKLLSMIGLVLIVLFSATACKKDAEKTCTDTFNFSLELQKESEEISVATNVYIAEPTPDNCDNFKKAYQDYLAAAKDLDECAEAVGQLAEYQAAIEAAEMALQTFECE